MFLLQKKRLSWISKKASDISPKRILGYTNQYRVFRRHKSIKAWKWLRTKVLVFFFCENEKLTHISLPYNIFFLKTWLGLYFCISDANCFSCHIPWISVVVMTPFCKFHHTYVLNRRCSNFSSLSLFKVNIFCFYYHITFIHSLKFNSLNIDRKSYSDFISNTRQFTINNWMTGSCNGVKNKIKLNDHIKNLKEFLLEDRWELAPFERFVFGTRVKMYKLWHAFISFLNIRADDYSLSIKECVIR